MKRPIGLIAVVGAGLLLATSIAATQMAVVPVIDGASAIWFKPSARATLPAYSEFKTPGGRIGLINATGPTETKDHPFFIPLGTNGRACVSCHQPADAMSLSVETIRTRWRQSGGSDPIFASVDGANCPNLPAKDPKSHSLLLEKGLFRIPLPWPSAPYAGKKITPEFTIEVVSDPTGCNTNPIYGLKSDHPTISVYRRPRMNANLTHVVETGYQFKFFSSKTGFPLATDPDTGKPVTMALMSDARQLTLKGQAFAAAGDHMTAKVRMTPEQQQRLEKFQRGLYVAKVGDDVGGSLVEPGGPPALGPLALQKKRVGGLGDNLNNPVFGDFSMWKRPDGAKLTAAEAYRASVARGHDVFFLRPFWIRDAAHMNNIGIGNPALRTCSTCHNQQLTGIDTGPGWMDIGSSNQPWADPAPDLPLFRITCDPKARPHPYLGRVILTHDPGRALITGKCIDVGAFNMHQFRGLSARAPYFTNGGAATVRAVVDFYNRRFEMKLTEQEASDLTHFLEAL